MEKRSTKGGFGSRVQEVWEGLEALARERIQQWLQALLEEEVTELLGRRKSERRSVVEEQSGAVYRNGYGKPRRLSMSCGTVQVRRPRVRGLEERFESRVLPLFVRRTAEHEAWRKRSLRGLEPVYLWADGIYVKAGLEKDKAALLVVVAGLRDGRKVVLAIEAGHRESVAAWSELLRGLRQRGMKAPRLVVADGHLGIWGAVAEIFPEAAEQRCWNHKILNVLDRLPRRLHAEAREMLRPIPYAETRERAEQLRDRFVERWGADHPAAAETLRRDWERMVTFYDFPREHWKHLRTTNPVESPFAAVRLRTDAGKRYKKVANATALIWRLLMVAERSFRRLDHPELLPEVGLGVRFLDGLRVIDQQEQNNELRRSAA